MADDAALQVLPKGLIDSTTVLQLRNLIEARGITAASLAQCLGVREATVRNWLDGTTVPSVHVVEAIFRLLRIVPVLVSVDEYKTGSTLRDYLSPEEQALWDGFPEDPREIILNQLRDLQLQRVRLEKDWQLGVVDEEDYKKLFLYISESTRRLTDSLAKLAMSAGWTGQPSAVEWVHGSPRGGGYDEEAVARVKKEQKKDEES